jgi:cell division topological specificity factor
MSILQYIQERLRKKDSASIAKERLQIIISHERAQQKRNTPDYLPKLQQEILEVISKYININKEQVVVQLERIGDNAVLELNVTIPEPVAEPA